jgi:hypothetical protein
MVKRNSSASKTNASGTGKILRATSAQRQWEESCREIVVYLRSGTFRPVSNSCLLDGGAEIRERASRT